MPTFPLTFEALHETEPGPAWQAHFQARWEGYRHWFLREGEACRATYAEGRRMLRNHMPELLGTYDALVDLAGGGDLAARMLSMWRPPAYLSGCSQGVWTAGEPMLVRNYDYAPQRLEGAVLSTGWQDRGVIGMGDCLWGLLDGVNEAGLAASLAFGGRPVVGEGFGVPLVMRYLLQVCETVAEAERVLARLPHQLAHTITLTDREGGVLTAYLAPDREVQFRRHPAATNHQGIVEWTEHATVTRTLERETAIVAMLQDPATSEARFVEGFLEPPLYSRDYSKGFGTLYTAVYRPLRGEAEYLWPGTSWRHSFAGGIDPTVHVMQLVEPAAA
jgi:predicted choloylglycine hydrolase